MSFSEEPIPPITPINFFQMSVDCRYIQHKAGSFPFFNKKNYSRYLLPSTSELCGEASFADLAMGWSEEGVEFFALVHRPFRRVSYPQIDRGDSIELFIDTRDVKTSGFNTRFCHHFFFLAEAVEGHLAGEITRFRTEDTHPLCDPNDLKVKSSFEKTSYVQQIFIPSHCLYGYEPEQFARLGFSYRINQAEGFPQHFSIVTDDFPIEQQPSLWSSLKLIRP